MMNTTIDTLEDLLHLLAKHGGVPTPGRTLPTFRLARYDVNFVQNISDHLIYKEEKTLTDAQYQLCIKLGKKYRRQLTKSLWNFDSFDWDNPKTQCNIIELDRTRKVYVDGDVIRARFRFDSTTVTSLIETARTAQGRFEWSAIEKNWIVFPSVHNVKEIVKWAMQKKFEIDPDLIEYYSIIINNSEKPHYVLERGNDGQLYITNALDSLNDAIKPMLERQDLLDLCFNSTRFGYTVGEGIQQEFADVYCSQFTDFEFAKKIIFDKVTYLTENQDLVKFLTELRKLAPSYFYAVCFSHTKQSNPLSAQLVEGVVDKRFMPAPTSTQWVKSNEKIEDHFDLIVYDSIMYKTGLRRSLLYQASNKIVLFEQT